MQQVTSDDIGRFTPSASGGEALIALGANMRSPVGPPAETVTRALEELQESGAVIRAVSPYYHTPAFPAGAGPQFVNAAARLAFPGGAQALLEGLHRIEARFGRTRARRWGQRTLDLDLLAVGQEVLPDAKSHARWRELDLAAQQAQSPEQLILPHPRLQDRAFVLVPLADVAPEWRHPILGQTVTQMLAALPAGLRDEVTLAQ